MNDLRLWANYYYNMGFNVTHINARKNQSAKNPYKSATNDRFEIQNRRQELSELQSFDWENSDGIGAVLGFNNLRALDFDFYIHSACFEKNKKGVFPMYPLQTWEVDKPYFKNNEAFIAKALNLLGLPEEYEWVIKTPSGGFHIIIFSSWHQFTIRNNRTKAFIPNSLTYSRTGLKRIEFRWNKHLVLPPSKNVSQDNYFFKNGAIPKNPPYEIDIKHFHTLLDEFCYEKIENESGYNLYYHRLNDDPEYIYEYDFGEFLDISAVHLNEQGSLIEIPKNWIK